MIRLSMPMQKLLRRIETTKEQLGTIGVFGVTNWLWLSIHLIPLVSVGAQPHSHARSLPSGTLRSWFYCLVLHAGDLDETHWLAAPLGRWWMKKRLTHGLVCPTTVPDPAGYI